MLGPLIEGVRMSGTQTIPKSKGTGVAWLRELIQKKGPEADQAMAKALSPDDYRAFRTSMPISWISEEAITRIFKAAGDVLFAEAPSPLAEVGRGMAKANMTGIYKFMLRVTTIPFIMSQASKLWQTLHDTGEATATEGPGRNMVTFTISGFPSIPSGMREVLRGYVTGLGELTNAKNVRTKIDETDPNAWKWISTWE
jgi:hypothetical protein